MDFTVAKYRKLLQSMQEAGYDFQTYKEFLVNTKPKAIVLRHDVDLLPKNSLLFAQIQADAGVSGVYYFRAVPESWDEAVINDIAGLGHEIGYHYECLTTTNGNVNAAYEDFCSNLKRLRELAPVATICMHGSPMSKFDSKDIWKSYNYYDLGIIGEPYFDTDFNEVFYLTDTGRKWDGDRVSVRDRTGVKKDRFFHKTDELISAFQEGSMPDQIMFTFHPQRWSDELIPWTKELVMQNIKNVVKRAFYVKG
jgi:hypothetical protein